MELSNLVHEGFQPRQGLSFLLAVVSQIQPGDVIEVLSKALGNGCHHHPRHARKGHDADDTRETLFHVIDSFANTQDRFSPKGVVHVLGTVVQYLRGGRLMNIEEHTPEGFREGVLVVPLNPIFDPALYEVFIESVGQAIFLVTVVCVEDPL